MTIYPEFYSLFRCRASSCRHSCCRGWEIDVDEDSRLFYEKLPGKLGDLLRTSLITDRDGTHFALLDGDRCPLLRPDGLCELICQMGEDALCEICAQHPRFYLDYSGLKLCGLGLSCEAVCMLLLSSSKPLRFLIKETGALMSLADLTGLPESSLVFTPYPDLPRWENMLTLFSRTEPIDADWTSAMEQIHRILPALTDAAKLHIADYPIAVYSRIGSYVVFRQLDRMDEYGPEVLLAYASLCVNFIFLLSVFNGDLAESIRRWSEQIEYSTENPEFLLNSL